MIKAKYVAMVVMDFCYDTPGITLEDMRHSIRYELDDALKRRISLGDPGITVTVEPMLKDVWEEQTMDSWNCEQMEGSHEED